MASKNLAVQNGRRQLAEASQLAKAAHLQNFMQVRQTFTTLLKAKVQFRLSKSFKLMKNRHVRFLIEI
jgi:hypothetical protein